MQPGGGKLASIWSITGLRQSHQGGAWTVRPSGGIRSHLAIPGRIPHFGYKTAAASGGGDAVAHLEERIL